jgi:mRNA-degrading endonuclease RelE of RelBE toxin-antitoxin system
LVEITKIVQTPTFNKTVKKLKENQKSCLDDAIKVLIKNPNSGTQKSGDLSYLLVYKFKMVKQEVLLGYSYQDGSVILELLSLGSHENFYRDIKKS